MNTYCETNFFLEIVFSHEQAGYCEKIISLAKKNKIKLIIPAYSFAEGIYKLEKQRRERADFQRELDTQLSQLTRTAQYSSQIKNFRTLDAFLTQNREEEIKRFEKYRKTLTKISEILAFDANTIDESRKVESKYNLTLQDAIIFSTTLKHLQKNKKYPSIFLNRNSKDFNTIDIKDRLKALNCKLIPSFKDGYNFILSQIK